MRTTRLRGARTHNLRDVDLDLEPGTLVVVAGPSGAGKSSLAFGTLYAEGQRRYVESFSAYARQFLERLGRPPIELLDPVPAAIAVDRQAPVKTSRSTVGTMTELADYGKSLWARAAVLVCPGCGGEVTRDSPTEAASRVLTEARGEKVMVTYPLPVQSAEHFLTVRDALLADGYRRLRLDGEVRDLDQIKPSEVKKRGKGRSVPLEVVADRVVADDRARLVEALEAAMLRGGGRADVVTDGGATLHFSRGLHCAKCDRAFRDASPGLFSFNSPLGACETCRGFGRTIGTDLARVIPDPRKTLAGGAIRPWATKSADWERTELAKKARLAGVPLDVPFADLTEEQRRWVIEGDGRGSRGWWGVRGWFKWLESRAYKMHVRVLLSRYRSYDECTACAGTRLKEEARWWKLGGKSISDFYALSIDEARAFLAPLAPLLARDPALDVVAKETTARLDTLSAVGLGYLTLDRASRTLSGGEAQRVALTSALAAQLSGALFVLDEPTVGLHPADVEKLIALVRRLADGGNIALVVEHDLAFVRAADRIVELGPGAGEQGGTIVFDGTPHNLSLSPSATGHALRLTSSTFTPLSERRSGKTVDDAPVSPQTVLQLAGASGHNLRDVTLRIPLGAVTVVTGPSGSGKSSLVLETLVPAVAKALSLPDAQVALPFSTLTGHEALRGVVHVDQSPLGRTSRGNPATYLGVWDVVRKWFAATPIARERGWGPGYFSFNVPGGRCEACRGEGAETVEMQFLADVTFECPECGGRRFVGAVLDAKLAGRSVADVLGMTAREALTVFDRPELERTLAPLIDVGLGYLRLGQPLSTLSGGEAQRLKLAEALSSSRPGSLIVLDEPTAGLHHADVTPLMTVIDRLVARGDTVVVVEHDMRLAAWADHVVDLGPGAGPLGGHIVAAGTPEEVARTESPTAKYLREALDLSPLTLSARATPPGRLSADATPPGPLSADATPPGRLSADATPPGPLSGAERGTTPEGSEGRALGEVIEVSGAREHNLKDVSLTIPREKLVVVTGPSGSGKSTLAFDVVHAEAQRRYLETLSPYARQFLPQLPRPAVDRVTGLPPSVSLEQRQTTGGGNSTVATTTEVAHHLRVAWARAGLLHCPDDGSPIAPRQVATLAEDVRRRFPSGEVLVLAPVVRAKKGHHGPVFARALKEGVQEARIDGAIVKLTRALRLARFKEHDVDLVVARLSTDDTMLDDALRRALALADGTARIKLLQKQRPGEKEAAGEILLSTKRACPTCGRGFPELDPRFFSFNTKQGQCTSCEGRGVIVEVVGRGKTLREVATPCDDCAGTRLSPLARAVTLAGHPISDVLSCSVTDARAQLETFALQGRAAEIADLPLREAVARLTFLEQVGLGYLGLDRAAQTLSGGEMQRVRLAAQLGSGLTGVLYVLDEPTIGLHPRDTGRLLAALRALVDKGCSVLVVEHDAETIRAADHLIDVGPGGGVRGGEIVAAGPARQLLAQATSLTARSLARPPAIPQRRPVETRTPRLVVERAAEHNLRGIDVAVPLGRLVCVTGVSGSGKSTFARDVLLRATRAALGLVNDVPPGAHAKLRGAEHVKRAIEVDQSPIGRTPRSVPATYVGVWDEIRKLLAATPDARAAGYGAGRFSFNVAEGRCPQCEGNGASTVEMAFLPEVLVPCDACFGMRFTPETRRAKLFGKDAGELLALDVADAAQLLAPFPKAARPLALLADLGLGYLKLGQPSNTLSGGEAQRLKLVAELSQATGGGSGPTLYVMDEPTTGLHRDDVARLVTLLQRLVDRGDTVVVIEHHTDVMLAADWLIDLGPEGGAGGGTVVAVGTPEEVARVATSHTGEVLARELKGAPSKSTRNSSDGRAYGAVGGSR